MPPTQPTPPAFARWILAYAAPRAHRDFLVDDLDEEFRLRSLHDGPRAAASWYGRQALASLTPLLWRRATAARPAFQPMRSPPMQLALTDDIKYAIRLARRTPWITAAVVVTLVIGLGVTTAVASIVNGLLLKPL